MKLSSISATVLFALAFTPVARADDAKPGRVTAIAPVIWACPLESWRLGQDDACDPIETGTVIRIHRRGVRPEYPHGPFALIEYNHAGITKTQYVIDSTVTPADQDDPTLETLIERERKRLENSKGTP
jgi:hypothetical protein